MKSGQTDRRDELFRQDAKLVQIVDASLADAVQRAGHHLACRPGCNQCCYGAFSINALDALRLRNAMTELEATEPERAANITERARKYLAQYSSSFPGDRKKGILGESPEMQAAFEDFADEAACPALDPSTGLCELYAARPMTCRTFGPPVRSQSESGEEEGLSVCELCFTEASPDEIAACEMSVPRAEEESLLAALEEIEPARSGETIVAYCLVPQQRVTASSEQP
jgi:Fe-S-cluster containining protein